MKIHRLLTLILTLLAGLFVWPAHAAQVDIPAPAGSSANYAANIVVLPNGNIVVVDTGYSIPAGAASVGAVYLLDGATLAVISTLTGSTANDAVGSDGITVLSNGNFLVRSLSWRNGAATNAGAVTWCSATTGVSGTVSASNSLVGGSAIDNVGQAVTALANGHYVVSSSSWNNPAGGVDAGAVTWCNGDTAGPRTVGLVTASNSLIGGTALDHVGGLNGGVTALPNGHYVVHTPDWDNPTGPKVDAGAVTWCNGDTAGPRTVGLVTASNSLVGGTASDFVGNFGVTALTNGHYVVGTRNWDNPTGPVVDAGAATWCNGDTSGPRTVGLITAGNSLIGGTTGDSNFVSVTALTNGHYVVAREGWDNPSGPVASVGAVTWCNGDTAGPRTVGLVTASNSLIGGTASDGVGSQGVTALANGNYVVASANWKNPAAPTVLVGAATWGNGTAAGPRTVGLVTASNSLIGDASHRVGGGGVRVLTNGHYVVNSVDAVTWCNGTTGIVGQVTTGNSLTSGGGNTYASALTNGNYVMVSPNWTNPSGPANQAGAVTWCNGASGTVGVVAASNSLVGGSTGDNVGSSGVTVLTNGHYVVRSPNWTNPSGSANQAGAVTWCDGATGTVGVVAASNSLVGGRTGDNVGSSGVTVLTNGHYVVRSPNWDHPDGFLADVGAVTWGNGTTGTVSLVTKGNSLIGYTESDQVGNTAVTALANGDYMVRSNNWDNPTGLGVVSDARALSHGDGVAGTIAGILRPANSVLGTVTNGITGVAFDPVRIRIFAGRGSSRILSIFIRGPFIHVEQASGTDLSSGNAIVAFGSAGVGSSSAAKTFTVKNIGIGSNDLTLSGMSVTGGQSGDFTVDTTGMLTTVPIGGQTAFTVTFTPSAGGPRNTTLSIANNDTTANPFLIALTGSVLSATTDTDGDGLNDLSEAQLGDLGFDWQASQPALVTTLFSDLGGAQSNLNAAGFYTTAQVQALHIGTPLLQQSGPGTFTLTIGVQKAAALGLPFTDFPLTVPQTTINAQGRLEFQFTVPDDAAFFRLETQ